jgi:hypothetical protein
LKPSRQTTLAIDALLYRNEFTFAELPSICGQVIASGAADIRLKFILSEKPVPDLFHDARLPRGVMVKSVLKSTTAISGAISSTPGKAESRHPSGRFYILNHPVNQLVWVLVTDSGGEFVRTTVRSVLRALHPRVTVPVFRTPQIETMLRSILDDPNEYTLRIRQIGGRAKIHSEGASKSLEADRKWTDLTFQEAFDEAKSSGQWITDVTAQFYPDPKTVGTVKIGRYGTMMLRGQGSSVFGRLIEHGCQFAQERYVFLRNRARSAERKNSPIPFDIDFHDEVLGSFEQISGLKRALHRIPRSTCTVLHGNPYFHAVMTDYSDGSVYEVLVLDSSRVTIIPQGRASVHALQRLSSYVFANFHEGEFKELADE